MEDLVELCILREYSIKEWWAYMNNYNYVCLKEGLMPECAEKTVTMTGLDKDIIARCVFGSFKGGRDERDCKYNELLDAELALMQKERVHLLPDVTINDFTFRV